MTAIAPSTSATSIDPGTQVGVVALTVANLERSLDYYTQALGFAVLRRSASDAVLGTEGNPLLLLTEQPDVRPWPVDGVTGLYHFAILLPSRADLGRWLRHYLALGHPLPGQGDHLVSEALYLRDPDGHGIEVYRDRPRSEWRWRNGQVQMAADPVDLRGLLAEADRAGEPWTGLPRGTRLGHIHLQVGDIAQAKAFYHDALGFDVVAAMPSALFVSAGGYHHHLGLNTWHSEGSEPAPAEVARLRLFTLELPSDEAQAAVIVRVTEAGLAHERLGKVVAVRDPWQNTILLHVGALSEAEAATRLGVPFPATA
jgi:catechol 2,3-dioxygenase